jgi:O-antigen ligase/polysaccharide polymerase Wzy-like membrane protein
MFAVPGILLLIFVEYIRPQEWFLPVLAQMPLLHLATGLVLLGFVVDLRLGLSRAEAAPHLRLTILFFLWALITVALRVPEQLPSRASALLVPMAIYGLVAHGIQSFRMLQVACAALLALCVILAALGVHQGLAPYGCHRQAVSQGQVVYLYDGRPCSEKARDVCETEGAEPGAEYVCERVGLVGTQSDHGRVRYRGTLQDPNELSLALGIAIPFAFAFFDRRRSLARLLLVLATVGMVGICAYFTQSRGGQLVFLTVLAVYFINRFGVRKGLIVGLLLALPLLLYGGRSGGEDSTMERTECWWVALHLLVASPLVGVGHGQFTEHHYLTAHNSYLLVGAEMGLPGLMIWTSIMYLAVKIPVQALRAELAPVGRSWALGLLASICGLAVGVLFLSYAYKDVLWIYVGLTGALYHAMRRHDPRFTVTFGMRDLGLVALFNVVLVGTLIGYTGIKLGW